MKLSKYITIGVMAVTLGAGAVSCTGDLDITPDDPNTKTELTSKEELLGYFSSLYAGFLYKGNLQTSDDGAGTFTRCHWNLQEITADEAIISKKWNDPGYDALNFNIWLNDNEWVYAAFSREFYTARMTSDFIAMAGKVGGGLVSDEELQAMIAEARVIRAYAYYQMIDLFGRGPWIDENSPTGVTPPTYNRQELFEAVTADLVATIASGHLRSGAKQVYGRLSEQAARMVLAKLYLNAEVYVGKAMYAECAEQCQAIVNSGLQLAKEYKFLFCASNDKYVGTGEIIWGLPQEVGAYETWGGTTYLTAGAYIESAPGEVLARLGAGKMNGSEFEGPNPWSGLRVRPELSKALDRQDARRLIYEGQYNEDIVDLVNYGPTSDGYMCIKYTYTTEADYYNEANAGNSSQMCNADYPIFRLADTYLMLAECQLKGVQCDGLKYFNMVRTRAKMPTVSVYTADDLLRERMCELYFEGCRRSDLIRFGKYSGNNYVWNYKGGVYEGASVPDYRKVFAIPYQYVATIGQNPGY